MVFSSLTFLLLFLPALLAVYFACRSIRLRNAVLLIGSLFFYAWWDVRYLPLLLVPPAVGVMVYAADIAADFWVIAGALVLSLLISMAFVGVLMQRLLKGHSHPQERP